MKNSKYFRLHEKISHLNEVQLDELLTRYCSNEKVSTLIKDFNINIAPSYFYTILPPKIHENCRCAYCNLPMVSQRVNRSGYQCEPIKCIQCDHVYNNEACGCTGCLVEIKKQMSELNNLKNFLLVSENISAKKMQIKMIDLSFKEHLYLSALLQTCLSENMQLILPLNISPNSLAPTRMYCEKILQHLYSKKIVVPSIIDQHLDAFIILENELAIIDLFSVTWELNLSHDNKDFGLFISHLKNIQNIDILNEKDIFDIWLEVATYECIEYLIKLLEKFRLPYNIGEKTYQVITNTLTKFSTSQVFHFLWKAVNNAVSFQRIRNSSFIHAVNTIPGFIETYSERVLANNWLIEGYKRNYDVEQSMLSKILYNSLLKIGDEGFKAVPNMMI